MSKDIIIEVVARRCKQCSICIAFCPKGVLEEGLLGEVVVKNASACSLCRLCELLCPDYAITVKGG